MRAAHPAARTLRLRSVGDLLWDLSDLPDSERRGTIQEHGESGGSFHAADHTGAVLRRAPQLSQWCATECAGPNLPETTSRGAGVAMRPVTLCVGLAIVSSVGSSRSRRANALSSVPASSCSSSMSSSSTTSGSPSSPRGAARAACDRMAAVQSLCRFNVRTDTETIGTSSGRCSDLAQLIPTLVYQALTDAPKVK